MKKLQFISLLSFLIVIAVEAQEKKTGPIIQNYGAVWNLNDLDVPTSMDMDLKLMLEVMNSPEDPSKLNPWIETAARFLNMHAQAGVPRENLHVALVVHNQASKDLLQDTIYKERYGTENPNSDMLKELMEAGVDVIFCGQSSSSRNVPAKATINGVKMALSAMTAILQLEQEDYTLIKF